ncbi:MAG: hypothetical protein GY755_22945 [Chloroflexi bacterium]|nr:hypothetical protein [Chloroflexota bacterium]
MRQNNHGKVSNGIFSLIKWIIGILFLTGVISHAMWNNGGPDWLFWVGNLAPALSLMMPGITTMFIPKLPLELVKHLGRVGRGYENLEWEHLDFLQKLYLYFLMFFLATLGAVVLFMTLFMFLHDCLPGTDCSGF